MAIERQSRSGILVLTILLRLAGLIGVVVLAFLAAAGTYALLDERTQALERAAAQAERIARDASAAKGQLFVAQDRAAAFFRSKQAAVIDAHATARADAAYRFEAIASQVPEASAIVASLRDYTRMVDDATTPRRQLGLNENEGLEGILRKAAQGIETRLETFRKTAADARSRPPSVLSSRCS